jgi:hypothetical protein
MRIIKSIPALLLFILPATVHAQQLIWKNSAFAVYADSIVQGNFVSRVLSANEITSNYQSPANEFQSPELSFKFSINGKDNEMKSGTDHHFVCTSKNGVCETPLIKFGQQLKIDAQNTGKNFLAPDSKLLVKLDMRDVLAGFNKEGYYTTFDGNKIYKEDFKGVYIAGGTAPMMWDFDNLVHHEELKLTDPDGDGIYETTLIMNETKKEKDLASTWKLSKSISAFPQYHSEYMISDAIYNMALEEMQRAIEPDSTFRTGKEWAGVWTRDISYSIILSMAYLQPKVAKNSLLRKVKNGKIIQDTGTGGAWPVSTDRMIWAVAAWELYKSTGDEDWLQQAYTIIKNSVDDDQHNAYDKLTGLVRGESSFLDWREQTYPKWMQPADIFESENLGTNAVHYQANIVLASMANLLRKGPEAKKYSAAAQKIKEGINHYLWLPSKGYYGQFLYGKNYKILSPKSESLGEALCILFDIAGPIQQKQVISGTPVTKFGVPCIYPQIPNIPPYHNNAVWPFVQSYWALAAAKAGNEKAVLQSISAIYRPSAMFLTNKENFVADNGDYKGTQINSSNMLWSLAGNISLVHKIIFGIEYLPRSLQFKPFVPYALRGTRSLTNFAYRKSILNIELTGFGNIIKSFTLDGKKTKASVIPETLTGTHSIKIELAGNRLTGSINELPNNVTLPITVPAYTSENLTWPPLQGAKQYKVLKNGQEMIRTSQTNINVTDGEYSEYQVIAIDNNGYESFANEPLVVEGNSEVRKIEMEDISHTAAYPYKGFSGKGFVEISKDKNTMLQIPLTIPKDGTYSIDFRYANGNGPTNTENKCAIRTIKDGSAILGTFVFPQRGVDEWSNWGYSNPVQAYFKKGKHVITLSYEMWNENMNGNINQAMLDYLRVTRID